MKNEIENDRKKKEHNVFYLFFSINIHSIIKCIKVKKRREKSIFDWKK
jgi:hypothetical protein